MSKFVKTALVSLGLFVFLGSNAFANAHWQHCIRMSFPGTNQGTMTNLCKKNLYAIWYDDNGEHSTAIGGNSSRDLGTIHGRFQVHDAYPQFGFDDNEASAPENKKGSHQAYKGISQAEMDRLSTLPRDEVAAYLRNHKLPPSETESCPGASRAECAFRAKYSLVAPTPEPSHVTNSQAPAHRCPYCARYFNRCIKEGTNPGSCESHYSNCILPMSEGGKGCGN